MALEKMKIQSLKKAYEGSYFSPHEVRDEGYEKGAGLDEAYGLFLTWLPKKDSDRHIIPAAAADNLCLEGERTTCASRIMENYHSPFSAFALEKAAVAGFEVVAKSNLDEFGIGDSTGVSPFKTTVNPWKEGHQGGSGAAAAVASGAVMAAFASDASGGLRQEASYSGVVGVKPTYGRVSRRGLIDYASSLDQVGVLGRCVEDAAYALAAISGHDPKDPTSIDRPVDFDPPLKQPGGPITMACPREWQEAKGLDAAVAKVFGKTLEHLSSQGIQIEEVSLPALKWSSPVTALIASVEAFSTLANFDGIRFGERTRGEHLQDMYVQTRTRGFGPRVKEFLTYGALVSSGKNYQDYFLWAQKCRRFIRDQVLALLENSFFIILPTVPFAPPPLEEKSPGPEPKGHIFTSPANLAGLPAVSLPAGIHDALPVGLQLIGRPFGEGPLLQAAALLEDIISFPGLALGEQEG